MTINSAELFVLVLVQKAAQLVQNTLGRALICLYRNITFVVRAGQRQYRLRLATKVSEPKLPYKVELTCIQIDHQADEGPRSVGACV